MKLKTAWWTMMIVYCIDLLVITPYALWKHNVQEVGLVCGWGFETFGFWFFPMWAIVFGLLLWLFLEFFYWICWSIKSKYREIPIWAIVIVWSVLMIGTIIHNLGVLI